MVVAVLFGFLQMASISANRGVGHRPCLRGIFVELYYLFVWAADHLSETFYVSSQLYLRHMDPEELASGAPVTSPT